MKLTAWAAIAALGAIFASYASGATIAWTSHDVAVDASDNTLWSNPLNWSGGVPPVAGDSVTIGIPVPNGSRTTNNDLALGTQINGIVMAANLNIINGNSINLGGNVSYTPGGTSIGTINAPLVLQQDTTFSVAANTSNGRLEIGGGISGSFGLTKADPGRLRFVGTAKSYTGNTIVTGGLLDVSANDMLPFGAGKGDLFIGTGAQLAINNVNTQINALNDYAGAAGAVNKSGSNTRSLTLGNNDASGAFSGAMTFTGGSSTVIKVGAGTQTLSGSVSVAGAGTVNGGRLNVNGAWTGSVLVNANGTLGGTGTISGAITGAGKVGPGMSIGTLAAGSATLGGTLVAELSGAASGSADLLSVTGALDITAATLDLSVLSALDDPAYVIATYGSLVGSSFAGVANLPVGYVVNYAYQGNSIAVTAVPEPGTIALVAVFAAGAVAVRRRG